MGQPQVLRRQNRQQVTEELFRQPSLTRPQLAERTGLSKVTVNAIVQELQRCGVVTLQGGEPQGCGRVPQQVALHPRLGLVIGLDVQRGRVLHECRTLAGEGISQGEVPVGGELNETVIALIRRVCADLPLWSVVIGIPAPLGDAGLPAEPNALPELDPARLRQELGPALHFENDANLAALAAAAELPEFAHLAVLLERRSGTGLGLLLNGEVYRGATGRAGELGRTPWPTPRGHEAIEQLPEAQRSEATAYALAGLSYTLDLQHVLIGSGAADSSELLRRTAALLPAGVTCSARTSCAELVCAGASLLALSLGRHRLQERLNTLSPLLPGETHVA
ncbi:ROK family transcriptional regulator [Deinococcus fonticola]|uniref:ROK family transcriptional regulator n=1 Tax=Deinococcus fonticola TaxID=2528713 RepID=UPI001074E2B9|nr:winged helix-turn-helix domain-containing protein [Deinococcus fonticola]